MIIKLRDIVRPCLRLPLSLILILAILFYWLLIYRISLLDLHNKGFKPPVILRPMPVESIFTYQVPEIPDAVGTLCETVHISIVCMGKCMQVVTPMLKSLLHHRQNPLHFHFIVDSTSERIINEFFTTWDLPDVKYTCYDAHRWLSSVTWVPNTHYSGVFGLIKLLFPDILPKSLNQVIVLDTDLTFLCDVAELWALFRNMTKKQVIGLVENESYWYLSANRWPALGQGFNTGVMLLDLKKIREGLDWMSLWHDAVYTNLVYLKETTLADQDVINAVIKNNPQLVYRLSCQYNVQMSTHSVAKSCYKEDLANVKIIHWNSPSKYNLRIRDTDVFRNIYKSYVNFDGNLLREKLHRCSQTEIVTLKTFLWQSLWRAATLIFVVWAEALAIIFYYNLSGVFAGIIVHTTIKFSKDKNQCDVWLKNLNVESWTPTCVSVICSLHFEEHEMNHSDLCLSFRAAQRVKLRTHIYYMDYVYDNMDNFDVTLVLQLSMDRLQFLERLVKYWEGPLSAAIYLSDCEVAKFESFIKDTSDLLKSRRNIGYHLVFKQDSVHYPVNYLRNVALSNVNTPYVFLMDADFVPMAGLYEHLREAIQLINPYPQKKCLVVPAFETQRYRASPPRSKPALLARLSANGDVALFRAREWPRGHRATNYSRWTTATAPYEVEWQPDYEPYLVVHRSVPKYDTRFSGFGWNKVSHSVELRAQGYRPVVLPGAFVVHTPHAPSADITAFRADPHYRICLALLKQEFMDDLKRKYNVTFEESKPENLYLAQAKSLLSNMAKDNEVN